MHYPVLANSTVSGVRATHLWAKLQRSPHGQSCVRICRSHILVLRRASRSIARCSSVAFAGSITEGALFWPGTLCVSATEGGSCLSSCSPCAYLQRGP